MTEQQPTYDAAEDFGGQLAQHSEYKPGETASFVAGAQLATGEVWHVSNGEGGQIYVVDTGSGFPEVFLAGDLATTDHPGVL